MDNLPKRKVSEPTPLNRNLKALRESRNETQRDVANALGISDNKMISWYENTGAMPSYNRLVALAEHYEVSMDELFGVNTKVSHKKRNITKKTLYQNESYVIDFSEKVKLQNGGGTTKTFSIKAESLNKKRMETLKFLLEEPLFLDLITNFLNRK